MISHNSSDGNRIYTVTFKNIRDDGIEENTDKTWHKILTILSVERISALDGCCFRIANILAISITVAVSGG